MHARMDAAQGNVAKNPPSRYLDRMFYDTIVHDAQTLRYLASRVPVERIVPEPGDVALYMLAAESLGAQAAERWWDV